MDGNRISLADHNIAVEHDHLTRREIRIQAIPVFIGDRILQHELRPGSFDQIADTISEFRLLLDGDKSAGHVLHQAWRRGDRQEVALAAASDEFAPMDRAHVDGLPP